MPTVQIEMPKYKCHKEVWALKIEKLAKPLPSGDCMFYPEDEKYDGVFLSKEFMDKHKPEKGGYYVVYKDGYESFSPAKAFENGYSLIN